ncbi:MAG: hypothetical protein K5764_04625 [Prevotella sp.]|nr:hypothetical protein [Prevotella sp.]
MLLLWQGSIVALAGEYNNDYTWEMSYIPEQSPVNLDEIAAILEKNSDVFSNISLNKGKGSKVGKDTLSFYMLQQLDHFETDQSKMKYLYQLVTIIKFLGADHTTVMHTNGYKTGSASYLDLAEALDANMIEVEHRYTAYSLPAPNSYLKNGGFLQNENYWNYNRAAQASDDIAFVVNTLKKLKIFNGKWVSTGTSKSGMTTTFLAMHHPETCDVYVPFCAPFCKTLDDPIGYWASEGYGENLKKLSEKSYKLWQTSWQRVKDFSKNATLCDELIKRERKYFENQNPNNSYSDVDCQTQLYLTFASEWYAKASYLQLEDWSDLIPSYVGPNDPVTKEYCDSMYRYLTIPFDSLYDYVYQKKQAALDNQSRQYIMRDYHHMTNLCSKLMSRRLARKAPAIDPETGLDSLVLTQDHYYVQTMYELGNYKNDYTMVKEEIEALNGKGSLEQHYFDELIFNRNGYKQIAQYIGLNMTTAPFLPLEPIEPKVKEFVKTTNAKVVFVYGGFDPWTGAGVKDEDIPASQTNISRFVVPGGTHNDYVLEKGYSWEPGFGNKIINKVKEMLGEPTGGIRTVQTEPSAARHDNVMYNLSGQQVDDSYKGIVIKNGKKIMK